MFKTILNKLGYISKKEHEESMESFRVSCRNFAEDYLRRPSGVTTCSDSDIRSADINGDLVLIGDRISLTNIRAKTITAAPWCKHVAITNIKVTSERPIHKLTRAAACYY